MRIRERCTCGAEFEIEQEYGDGGWFPVWEHIHRIWARSWRPDHARMCKMMAEAIAPHVEFQAKLEAKRIQARAKRRESAQRSAETRKQRAVQNAS